MADTSVLYVRIDNKLKSSAEEILSKLGISPSSAIQMFYSQIVLNKGIPFDLKLEYERPIDISKLSKEDILKEIEKGIYSFEKEELYVAEDVNEELEKKYKL